MDDTLESIRLLTVVQKRRFWAWELLLYCLFSASNIERPTLNVEYEKIPYPTFDVGRWKFDVQEVDLRPLSGRNAHPYPKGGST